MAHPTWALGFEDEVWWSRLAQPDQHCWTDAEATQKLQELTPPAADPDPKALACYGLLVRPQPQQEEQMWLRFVTGRPVSAVTSAFLAWCCAQLAAQGFTALLLIWDNASWHRSGQVAYAVLSFGGFLGIGSDDYPIPWASLSYDTSLGGYRTNITEQQLQGAPKYTGSSWDWEDRERGRKVYDYYGASWREY